MNSRKTFFKKLAGLISLGWLFAPDSHAASTKENEAAMSTQPYIGQIALFPYNFAPRGWADCNGQLLAISQHTALFSLIGTIYGGDGQTTFALPDLRGRVLMGVGQGPGLTQRNLGQSFGTETHTLTVNEIPAHTHTQNASSNPGTSHNPDGNVPAANRDGILHYDSSANINVSSGASGSTGNSQPHNNMQPSLVMRYCIALQGVYPSRN